MTDAEHNGPYERRRLMMMIVTWRDIYETNLWRTKSSSEQRL